MKHNKRPLTWIATLYYMQGIPYAVVSLLTVIMYKNFNVSNTKIAFFTSLLILPWSFKPFWSPLLERIATKRQLTLFFQLILSVLFFILGFTLFNKHYFSLGIIIFMLIGFFSASYDITADGLYLVNLTNEQQTRFVGIRSFFYQLARFSCQGGLVMIAGILMSKYGPNRAWMAIYFILSSLTFLFLLYHYKALPEKESKHSLAAKLFSHAHSSISIWKEFFKIPSIVNFLCVLLLFNLPEAQLLKMTPLFLLDNNTNGGLQLTTTEVGFILGLIGVACLMFGALITGWVITRFSLVKAFPWIALLTVITNISYIYLSLTNHPNIYIATILIGLAQFAFGLSNSAYMAYILRKVSIEKYRMTYYAIATAIMALGMAAPAAVSGYLQHLLGYSLFFTWILVCGIFIYILTCFTVKHDHTL